MREIGIIAVRADAGRFADYLLTLGISTRLEDKSDGAAIWVHDEEQVARAAQELAQFVEQPKDPRYDQVERQAHGLRKAKERKQAKVRENYVDMRERWEPIPRGFLPVTMLLVAGSLLVAFVTRLGADRETWLYRLTIAEVRQYEIPNFENGGLPWRPGFRDVADGQVWRLVTPIFIHWTVLHLLFIMSWLVQLGGLIEGRRGSLRLALLVLTTAVISNAAEYYWSGHPFFGGMSGVVYGLFGYAWMKSRYEPKAKLYLHPNLVVLFLVWLVLCLTDLMGPVANTAHIAGLIAGMAIGYAPTLWLRIIGR